MGWAGSRLDPNISSISKWVNLGLSGGKYEAQLGLPDYILHKVNMNLTKKKKKKNRKVFKIWREKNEKPGQARLGLSRVLSCEELS